MQTVKLESRRTFYWLTIFTLTIAFGFQGSRGLFESTEGRYAEAAREMVESGDWLVPRLNYQPHWTKPPLTYWVFAGGIKLLGPNEWGVRIGNALAFYLVVLVLVQLGSAMWDKITGLLAGIIYASSLFTVVAANNISTDMILSFWEILTVLAYWKAFRNPAARSSRRWMLIMWFSSGLAFLTKGPPGLLSFLVVLIFHFYLKKKGWKVPRLSAGFGLPLFIIVGFSWYLIVVLKYPGLLDYFLGQEVVARVLTKKFNRNPQWYAPLYVYGGPLLLGAGAWIYLWPKVFRRIKEMFHSPGGIRSRIQQQPAILFLSFYLIVPLLILSISQSRLPLYVLPFFPAVALLLSRPLVKIVYQKKTLRQVWIIALISGVILLGLKKTADYYNSPKNMKPLAATVLAEAPQGAYFYLFDENLLYGLQFYLGDRMYRVSDRENPEPGVLKMERLLEKIKAERPAVPVFIVENKNLERLEDQFDLRKMQYRLEKGLGQYRLVILK